MAYPSEKMAEVMGGVAVYDAIDHLSAPLVYRKAISLREIVCIDRVTLSDDQKVHWVDWDDFTWVTLSVGGGCAVHASFDDLLELWRAAMRG